MSKRPGPEVVRRAVAIGEALNSDVYVSAEERLRRVGVALQPWPKVQNSDTVSEFFEGDLKRPSRAAFFVDPRFEFTITSTHSKCRKHSL